MTSRNPLGFLNIANWSLRGKLALGLSLAVIIPTIAFYIVISDRATSLSVTTVRDYLTQIGQDRKARLDRALGDARGALRSIADNPLYSQQITFVLDDNDPTAVRRAQVVNVMNSLLVSSRLFTNVRLLNPNGAVVARTNQASNESDNESNFQGFLAGLKAGQLREEPELVIYQTVPEAPTEPSRSIIEVVQLIYRENQQVAGYLIGEIDIEFVILNNLTLASNAFIQPRSYLATADSVIFSAPEDRAAIEQAISASPIEQALRGQTGVQDYTIRTTPYTAYYSRLAERGLALITETSDLLSYALTPYQALGENATLLIALGAVIVLLTVLLNWLIAVPIIEVREALERMRNGDFESPVRAANFNDETGALARAFISLRVQLRDIIRGLEERLDARDRDILATQEVSRAAATQRDLQFLMDEVVNLIINQFTNIYHAQIFLVDHDRRYAVLRASTGEAGQKLLARGHRLAVGSLSVIGQVTEQGRPVVAADISTSEVHRRNEFLQETEAELAIPLRVGERIIGALDVQSKLTNTFDEDQIKILQTMADQIAIAIENARLYEESIKQLEEVVSSNRDKTYLAWQEELHARRQRELVVETRPIVERDPELNRLRDQALASGQVAVGTTTERRTVPLAVPIKLRGQVLGAVEWELPLIDFNEEKIHLAEELVSRLAVSLDNARLFEQSQRGIARERLLNGIAARLAGQTNVKEIMQIAVREVGQALRAPGVNIQLRLGESNSSNGSHNGSNGSNNTNGTHANDSTDT